MKQDNNTYNNGTDPSRRDFIKVTTLAAATVACGSLACSCGGKHNAAAAGGDKIKLLGTDGSIIEVDSAEIRFHEHMALAAEVQERTGIPGKKFVMVVDLAR